MILVTGASGTIGTALVDRLVSQGLDPVPAGRKPDVLARRWPGLEPREVDVLRPTTLPRALQDAETVYYLVHSMEPGTGTFDERDRAGALNLAAAAREAGVRRIVYLGGPGHDEGDLSAHLRSRQDTGRALASTDVPVLEFRAAMVVAAGSASFTMLGDLVKRLPVMVVPRWVRSRSQPIALDDVIRYLDAGRSVDLPEHHTVVEIGGPDVVSYADMVGLFAKATGRRRTLIDVPFLTPRLSSLWCGLTTSVPKEVARPLIDGMTADLIITDDLASRLFPQIEPVTFEEALRRALEAEDR